MNYDFIKKYKTNSPGDPLFLNISRKLASLDYLEIDSFKEMGKDEVIDTVKVILKQINSEYLDIFNKMLEEQDCNKPVVYFLTSQNRIWENESNTFKNEIYFYRTGTVADVYILLHEFSHFLTNRQESYLRDINNKRYNEIIPFLVEYIVSNTLGDDNYLRLRYNEAIYNAKSIMVKEELNTSDKDIEVLFKKYSISGEEKDKIVADILYGKSLNYEEETRYIYGYLYAYYYSTYDAISSYCSLVEEYTIDRNIEFPALDKVDPTPRVFSK